MKIVHLLGWYFPDSVGGTEVYVEALCRRLRAAGHDVRIAAPDSHHAASPEYLHDGVPVLRYAIPNAPTRDEAYHRVVVRGGERLHRWLEQERPDVLHVHSFTTGVGLPEIRKARALGIRVIVTCHLPGLGYMCRTGELMRWGRVPCDGIVEAAKCASCNLSRLGLAQPIAQVIGAVPAPVSAALRHLPGRIGTTLGMSASIDEHRHMQAELFGLVERFVVLNETARRMLVANGSPAEKIVMNRLGLSQPPAAAKPPAAIRPTQPPVTFGCVGRLHPSKGLTVLAQAVASIPRDVPFRLEIRGPELDPDSRRYAAELRAMGAGDPRVVFAPAVPAADIPRVLAGIDVLLVPSLTFENGPTIALEAMAAGTPVVASRVGNLPEIIEPAAGRLFNAGDVPGLAATLREIALDPASTVDAWRRHLPTPRTMDDVTRDYLSLYAA